MIKTKNGSYVRTAGTWEVPYTEQDASILVDILEEMKDDEDQTVETVKGALWNHFGDDMLYDDIDRLPERATGLKIKRIFAQHLKSMIENQEEYDEDFESEALEIAGKFVSEYDKDKTKNGSYVRLGLMVGDTEITRHVRVYMNPAAIQNLKSDVYIPSTEEEMDDASFSDWMQESGYSLRGEDILNAEGKQMGYIETEPYKIGTDNGSYIRADAVNFTDEPAQIDMDGETPRDQDVNPAFPMKKRPSKNTGTPSVKPLAYGADEGGKKDYHDWEEYKSALKTRIDTETGYSADTEASGGNDGVVRLMVGDYDLTGTLYYNAEEGWLCHSWNAIYTPDDGEPQDAGSLSCTYGDLDDALNTLKQSITILEGGE